MMQEPLAVQPSEALAGIPVGDAAAAQAFRGRISLRLVDIAIVMLRVAAILVLLSPLLGAAFILA